MHPRIEEREMAFAGRLEAEHNSLWAEGYLGYAELEAHVNAAADVAPGTVCNPDEVIAKFVAVVQAQLDKVDGFYTEVEAGLAGEWEAVKACQAAAAAAAGGAHSDEDRTSLSVLKSHVLRSCKATPGKCPAVARLEKSAEAMKRPIARFVLIHERAQMLRHFVTLNHLGFNKILAAFEENTGHADAAFFSANIEAAKFYASHGLSRVLTDMECAAKALLVRTDAEAEAGIKSQDAFTCGVCLDILKKPVVLSCAHRFCWHCAASSCVSAASSVDWSCPLCRRVQAMSEETFTVSSELETFISEHVHHNPLGVEVPPMPVGDSISEQEMTFSDIVHAKENAWSTGAATDGSDSDSSLASSAAGGGGDSDAKKEPAELQMSIAPFAIATAIAQPSFGSLMHDPLPQKFVGKTISLQVRHCLGARVLTALLC